MPSAQSRPDFPREFESVSVVVERPLRLGTPSRGLILAGAVGQFVTAGASIPSMILLNISFLLGRGGLLSLGEGPILVLAITIFAALFLQSVGFLGLGIQYRSGFCYGVFGVGLAAAVFWLGTFAQLLNSDLMNIILLVYLAFFLVGVFSIVQGVGFLVIRKAATLTGPIAASGGLFILAGMCLWLVWLPPLGFVALLPAAFLGGVAFARDFEAPDQVLGPPIVDSPPGPWRRSR